jgi:GDP-L-fucose synthase
MKVLVTGGSGLVGKNLRKICGDKNFIYLSSKDCNLINYEETERVFNDYKPDAVIHLAAKVGGLYMNMENNIQMLEDNLLINVNVVKVCRTMKIKKFIGCLSTCIFPDKVKYPITENQLRNGPPHPSNEGYAYGKRMLAVMCDQINKIPGFNYTYISPTNIYGRYDNFHLKNSHVIPGLIHKCYLAKKNKVPFKIMGSGKALRQFIYVEDLSKIIKYLLLNYKGNERHIICSSNITDEVSIKYIVEKISKIMKYKNIIYDTKYSDGQLKKTVSNKILKKVYPELEFTHINIGLEKTIKWFIENYEIIRK